MVLGADPAEIRHLPWQVRHRLLRAAGKRALHDPAFWAGFCGGIVVLSMFINCALMFLSPWMPPKSTSDFSR
jgi:hypothetical protein